MMSYHKTRTHLLWLWSGVVMLSFVITFYLALFYAGTDPVMGNVQRIFYMHVASFMLTIFIGYALRLFLTYRSLRHKYDFLDET